MARNMTPCDIVLFLRDLSSDFAAHVTERTQPSVEDVQRWSRLMCNAIHVCAQLEDACEAIVEHGANDERTRVLEHALAHAQGQVEYWPKKDRW